MKKILAFSLAIFLVGALMVIGCSSPTPSPSTSAAPPPPTTSTQPATSTVPTTTSTQPTTSTTTPAASPAAKLPQKIIMGTHAVGTAAYANATVLAKIASEYSGMLVVVQPFSGPAAWVPLMTSNDNPEIGNAHTLDAWWQYSGKVSPVPVPGNLLGNTPFYKQAYTNLRMIASPWVLVTGEIVRADSGIKNWSDLKAELKTKKLRISAGFTSQRAAFATTISDFLDEGVTMDDFTPVTVANSPGAVKAFQQGQVDVTNAALNFPLVEQMAATIPVRFLSASDDPANVAKVSRFFPDATYDTWPAGSSTGVDAPTVLLTFPYVVETTTSTPDNVVEALLNAWWNHIDQLRQQGGLSYSKLLSPDQLMLKEPPIPYAQGAINFYKSKGIWTSAMQTYQDQLLNGVFPFAQQ